MTWTTCPRCQGEVGDWCGGNCHDGGLYICEACGHAEDEQHEQCPKCGDLDVDVRIARLTQEAEEGSTEAAANLFALQSPEPDKVSLQEAFLAGAKYAHGSADPELLEALNQIAKLYEKSEGSNYEMAFLAYNMRCIARSAIAKAKGGTQ